MGESCLKWRCAPRRISPSKSSQKRKAGARRKIQGEKSSRERRAPGREELQGEKSSREKASRREL
jgi:hypothetical protein